MGAANSAVFKSDDGTHQDRNGAHISNWRDQEFALDKTMHYKRVEHVGDGPQDGPQLGVYPETYVVDPIKRDAWIHDGENDHQASQARGRVLDEAARVKSSKSINTAPPVPYYTPSVADVKGVGGEYAHANWGLSGWRGIYNGVDWRDEKTGVTKSASTYPAITKLKLEDRIPEKSRGQIEAEIRQSERLHSDRLFDRSGGLRP